MATNMWIVLVWYFDELWTVVESFKKASNLSWTHITESTQRWICFWCMCWQHTAPNTYIENLRSHSHAIIRTHYFDFNIRFWPITTLNWKPYIECEFDVGYFLWDMAMILKLGRNHLQKILWCGQTTSRLVVDLHFCIFLCRQ